MRTIIKVVSVLIIIGVIGLCLNVALGAQTVAYLSKHSLDANNARIGYYYTFDFDQYIKNLNTSVSDLSILQLDLPNADWGNVISSIKTIVNYLILIADVILYPFRVFGYLCKNIMAILGVNMNTEAERNGLAWLVTFLDKIIILFKIPYIAY